MITEEKISKFAGLPISFLQEVQDALIEGGVSIADSDAIAAFDADVLKEKLTAGKTEEEAKKAEDMLTRWMNKLKEQMAEAKRVRKLKLITGLRN